VRITITKGSYRREIEVEDGTQVSDGYHAFDELYDHRITLWIALCRVMTEKYHRCDDVSWRSKLHSDGTSFPGWFVLGMFYDPGEQMTYHLPLSRWEETDFAKELDKAPDFDGHSAEDVLQRIKSLA
jgi:hypothetical protein